MSDGRYLGLRINWQLHLALFVTFQIEIFLDPILMLDSRLPTQLKSNYVQNLQKYKKWPVWILML